MALPTIFDLCEPREDILRGTITEADFAADLAQVLRGEAPPQYRDPALFFANTHPTRGLRDLLRNVCQRLGGGGGEVSAIYRLDTQYGGGKTHALIALAHAARGLTGVADVAEFVDPALLPHGGVRVAAFDGENADPANGRPLAKGLRAQTPWGELAFALGGKEGFDIVARSDEQHVAPGADTLRELFGGAPTLLLLDELAVYLRKVKRQPDARGQLTAFLTSLFKAVEGTPNACVVYTLAIGKEGKAVDAYSEENLYVADRMSEAESVSARKAVLLDPTAEDETAQVIRRRLFSSVDDARAAEVVAAYAELWKTHAEAIPRERVKEDRAAELARGYPLHPELMATLMNKAATLGNFQRVRGMLRLLARTVARLWQTRPACAHAVHLHHVDLGHVPIRQEVVTRLGLPAFDPPIRNDVAAGDDSKPALAQELDAQHYAGLPPYSSYLARAVLLHTLAFNEELKGCTAEELRYSLLAPGLDPSFIDDARKRFIASSAYLDDRPHVPMRFLTEANLTQIIRRQEAQADAGEVRAQLNDRIKTIFAGQVFHPVPFAAGPHDVPDDPADGRPYLVLIGYDAESVRSDAVAVPALVERIFRHRGAAGTELRHNLNCLVFLVADEVRKDEMRKMMVRRLALEALRQPERLSELAEHQRDRVLELFQRAEQEVALAIQQCYRHLLYPSRLRLEGAAVDLAHTAIEVEKASEKPGMGQQQVVGALRGHKLRLGDDEPDSPSFVRDRTPLKKGQIATATLRNEFRRDPSLPMLVGDDIFVRGVRKGVELGEYVYRSGDLLYGKGDPFAEIKIDEQSVIFTMAYAKQRGIWPRPAPKVDPPPKGAEDKTITDPIPPPPPPAIPGTFTSEGPLKQALTELWEKARGGNVVAVAKLTMRLFDAADAMKMLSAVEAVAGTDKSVQLKGSYETQAGGTLEMEFHGSVPDALPVKDFLVAQLRGSQDSHFETTFKLAFTGGLPMEGEAPKNLTDKLAKYASGAAYVTATAQAQPGGAPA